MSVKVGRLTSELWKLLATYFRRGSPGRTNGTLYAFEAPLLGYTRSVPAVIKGDLNWVKQFIPIVEFKTLFGGYITWHPTEDIGETIGVWGKRNVSRFRRILKERGAEFDLINDEGPVQRLGRNHARILQTRPAKRQKTEEIVAVATLQASATPLHACTGTL